MRQWILPKCFLPKGTVVFQAEERSGERKKYKLEEDYEPFAFDQIVILMNQNTASASEALISALDDNLSDKVVLVGETTYGKGTMQTSVPFADGTSLKYTSAQWFSSKGKTINGVGIAPDVEISLDEARSVSMPMYSQEIEVKEDQVRPLPNRCRSICAFSVMGPTAAMNIFPHSPAEALLQFQSGSRSGGRRCD